jgi:hypothetical protein
MVLGRSCSESGASLGEKESGGGGCLGTRLYFVLLGEVSASSSCKNDWNSLSATSSRDRELGVGV